MEYYLKMHKRVIKTLDMHNVMIRELEDKSLIAFEDGDSAEVINLAYDIEMLKRFYNDLRCEHDPYYQKALYYRPLLAEVINEDNLEEALDIAKAFGHNKSFICGMLGLNKVNLSSYLKGKIPYPMENKHKIYGYVRRILY